MRAIADVLNTSTNTTMKLSKILVAKTQIDTAIELFLSDKDFVSALTLAGAAEEILGSILKRGNSNYILHDLHQWYQQAKNDPIKFGPFSKLANFTRNTLKHANESTEDEVEVFRWEAVQMLMRAMTNWHKLGQTPDDVMLKFNAWIKANEGAYENIE